MVDLGDTDVLTDEGNSSMSPVVDMELGSDTTWAWEQGYKGILPSEVAEATMKALKKDKYEIVISEARGLVEGSRKDCEKIFQQLNNW